MENMKNEVSFNINITNVSLSESLTVTVLIIMFKSKTRTALLISPTLVGPLILKHNNLAHSIFKGKNTELEDIRLAVQDAAQTLTGLNTSVNKKFLHFQQRIMQLDQKVHIPECIFGCHFVPNFESTSD